VPLLLPLSLIFKTVVVLRNIFYDVGIFTSCRFGIPVISIGNITVGGTGKTPHTEYLIDVLSVDFTLAVLSRGYKRRSKGFQYVEVGDSISKTGDEPLQLKRKYPDVVVAVDADRVHGIKRLQTDYPRLDLILLDDAFQHRQVSPSLNIVLIDCNRPVWNDSFLPAGRLRDNMSSLRRADIIMITKCPLDMSHDFKQTYVDKLKKYNRPVYFSRIEHREAYPLSSSSGALFDSSHLLAVSGIANPTTFVELVEKLYPEAVVEQCAFPDHHAFSDKDVHNILTKADSHIIVTTEKDSVRLISYFNKTKERTPENIYCIPVKVTIDDSDSFNLNITNHVRKNKENGRLYQN
jgi:tetraacyldisaccharide 4'-kinase